MTIVHVRCGHCREVFPHTAEFFHRNAREPLGLQHWCKVCMRNVMRQHERERLAAVQQVRRAERADAATV